jgi:IS30 family transposase
MLITHT